MGLFLPVLKLSLLLHQMSLRKFYGFFMRQKSLPFINCTNDLGHGLCCTNHLDNGGRRRAWRKEQTAVQVLHNELEAYSAALKARGSLMMWLGPVCDGLARRAASTVCRHQKTLQVELSYQ